MARLRPKTWVALGLLAALTLAALLALMPLPRDLRQRSSGSCLRFTDREGRLLQERIVGSQGRGQWVELYEVSPHLVQATVAVEDRRFYRHWGVDPLAVGRALQQAARTGKVVSGASTLTQQLARSVYGLPRRWWAKPIEMILAVRLELTLSKEELLTQYLNRVPYGNGTVGVEAAARLYFAKPALHLTLAEAALLAGLPQSPARYDPYRYPDAAKCRQEHVLLAMRRCGAIDSSAFAEARAAKLHLTPAGRSFSAPHFCDWILLNRRRLHLPNSGTVRTTIDLPIQQAIERLVQSHLHLLADKNVTNAAVLVLDNADAGVVAMVGSADYFDELHQGQVNGCSALRQPGSTIKPFTYGLALERGRTPADILPDIETHAVTAGGEFRVQNYDRIFHGPVRLRVALACSYNVPAVRVLEEIGTEVLLAKLRAAGFASLSKPAVHYGLGLTLGNGEVTLVELTRAYCALANGGILRWERLLADRPPDPGSARLFSPQVTYLLTHILADREARMGAFGEGNALELPFPCAAKTGTSKDYRDNWALGYTSRYTVGVWVGNFSGQAMHKVSGITGAGVLFRDIMLLLHRDAWPEAFPVPPGIAEKVICARSGEVPGPYCPGTVRELFIAGTEPTRGCSVHRPFLTAAKDSGRIHQQVRVYEVWPPFYERWVVGAGLPRPIAASARLEQDKQPMPTREGPTITFPDDGDIYKIDPVLRPEFQTLALDLVVPPGVRQLSWWVDDSLFCTLEHPFHTRWRLSRGRHRFQVMAETSAGTLLSRPVHILVL
ncbi:MAG: penicillin-binding protein 1C [Candidatus Oleimicrobiaceae bacterium]